MIHSWTRRHLPAIWQIAFILTATTWLWASQLNHHLSYRISLISQYESAAQPYSWLFRLGDFLGASLLIAIPVYMLRKRKASLGVWLLLVVALGMMLDPIFSTTCHTQAGVCREYVSSSFILHAIESVVLAFAIFGLTVYDYLRRKNLLSLSMIAFQLCYGLLFLSQAADNRYNTISQYVYQLILVLWLAWYARESFWNNHWPKFSVEKTALTKNFFALWALLNGILAILISLAHLHLLGRIRGLYFAGDTAWLAQHGVIIGVIMIYISRHLARGERRARQIFLAITGLEALKYSLITPHPILLALYSLTFCALFAAGQSFIRGPVSLTWELRLKDAAYFICALLISVILAFSLLDLDEGRAEITNRSIDHFFDYTLRNNIAQHVHGPSVLLAHTASVLIVASGITLIWILFKPQNLGRRRMPETEVDRLLHKYSNSTEDYFKLWPADKDYFQVPHIDGFIAYKTEGSIAFALADPIADGGNKEVILENFLELCRQKSLRACFLAVGQNSLQLYRGIGLNEMPIGSTAVVEVDKFLTTTARDKWWRWKSNRAVKAGYQHHISQPPHSDQLMRQFKNISDAWLTHNGHQERGFALGYFDSNYLNRCAIDYLTDDKGRAMAFVNRLPLFKAGNMTTIDLLRYNPDAKDAMPHLLLKTIEQINDDEESYKYFDLGFVPFAKARGPLLTIAKTLSAGRFSSKGLEQFKNKFDPDWQQIYMCYDGDIADLALIGVNLEKVMSLKTG